MSRDTLIGMIFRLAHYFLNFVRLISKPFPRLERKCPISTFQVLHKTILYTQFPSPRFPLRRMHARVLLDSTRGGHVRDDGHGQRFRSSAKVLQHAVLTVRHVYVEHRTTLLLGSLPSHETVDPRDDNCVNLVQSNLRALTTEAMLC